MRRFPVVLLSMVLVATSLQVLACVQEIEWNDNVEYADFIGSVPENACGVGTIGEPGDVDVWAFEISQPALTRIETTANGYEGDTIIALYDEQVVPIASDDDSGEGYFSLIDLEAAGRILDAGYYYVAVADVDSGFSSNQVYQITVSGRPPEETPESDSPDSWDCDMSQYVTLQITSHMHLTNNEGIEGFYKPGVSNDWEHPLEWSGGSFSVAYTTTHTVDTTETITKISISGRVSSDCRTLLSVTASREDEQWDSGGLNWTDTTEITLINLPLDQSGVLVPRCNLEGQGITTHVAHFVDKTEFARSSEDTHWVESFSLHAEDGMRIEFRVRVDD